MGKHILSVVVVFFIATITACSQNESQLGDTDLRRHSVLAVRNLRSNGSIVTLRVLSANGSCLEAESGDTYCEIQSGSGVAYPCVVFSNGEVSSCDSTEGEVIRCASNEDKYICDPDFDPCVCRTTPCPLMHSRACEL